MVALNAAYLYFEGWNWASQKVYMSCICRASQVMSIADSVSIVSNNYAAYEDHGNNEYCRQCKANEQTIVKHRNIVTIQSTTPIAKLKSMKQTRTTCTFHLRQLQE